MFTEINKDLPKKQLERALKFGAKIEGIDRPDIWVDAYLGFSQRLPLKPDLLDIINHANMGSWQRISLDIPTGFLGNSDMPFFQADKVMSLAASKKILYHLPESTEIFIADLGIPKEVYRKFGVKVPPFDLSNILKIKLKGYEE